MQNITTLPPAVVLLVDGHHGKYVPKVFADDVAELWHDIDPIDLEAIRDPECEGYWQAWENILNSAHKIGYTLHHDGDLWALNHDRMTDEEKSNFGLTD